MKPTIDAPAGGINALLQRKSAKTQGRVSKFCADAEGNGTQEQENIWIASPSNLIDSSTRKRPTVGSILQLSE